MGNCVGGFKEQHRRKKLQHRKKVRKIRICILGLDGAGKSTAICALASGELNDILPTNGFTLREFRYKKAEITAYDLGGGNGIRSIWKNYYPEVFAVIYVIDGSEGDRIDESGELLKNVISDEDLHNKPFLIILNKKDRERCIDEIRFSDRFNLHTLANQYQTKIRMEICQSNAGSGRMIDSTLKDGFEWLLEQIYHDYEILEKRVNEALEKLKRRQNEERIRRQHHLAATVSWSAKWKSLLSSCYNIFSSSTISDEKSNDTGTVVATVQHTNQQIQENELVDHPTIMPSTKLNINQMSNNSRVENERNKQKRLQRNMINPTNDLPLESIDSTTMKYPQIFEVKALFEKLQESKTASKAQADGTLNMNANSQSTSKPARITQLVPLTIIPHQRSRRAIRPLHRWRTDSI